MSIDLKAHARALERASSRAHDPSFAVARALVDDPLFSDWAAPEALRLLGAPRTPDEVIGRLIVLARGPDAAAMVSGANAVFGEAIDEVVIHDSGPEIRVAASDRLADRVGSLGRDDRLLILDSDRALPDEVPDGPSQTDGIERLARWAAPARVICVSLATAADSVATFGDARLDFRAVGSSRAGSDAALAEARVRGLATTMLTTNLEGSPESAGKALARVGLAIQGGLGGLVPPACAIASGRVHGGDRRHREVVDAAASTLGASEGVVVECWSPGPGALDLFAVLVAPAD